MLPVMRRPPEICKSPMQRPAKMESDDILDSGQLPAGLSVSKRYSCDVHMLVSTFTSSIDIPTCPFVCS